PHRKRPSVANLCCHQTVLHSCLTLDETASATFLNPLGSSKASGDGCPADTARNQFTFPSAGHDNKFELVSGVMGCETLIPGPKLGITVISCGLHPLTLCRAKLPSAEAANPRLALRKVNRYRQYMHASSRS